MHLCCIFNYAQDKLDMIRSQNPKNKFRRLNPRYSLCSNESFGNLLFRQQHRSSNQMLLRSFMGLFLLCLPLKQRRTSISWVLPARRVHVSQRLPCFSVKKPLPTRQSAKHRNYLYLLSKLWVCIYNIFNIYIHMYINSKIRLLTIENRRFERLAGMRVDNNFFRLRI